MVIPVISERQPVGHNRAFEIDDRIRQEIIGETVAKTMHQLMSEGWLVLEKETQPAPREKFNKGLGKSVMESRSEVTIYEPAVKEKPVVNEQDIIKLVNRDSTSSEEAVDTSDEAIDMYLSEQQQQNFDIAQQFNALSVIAGTRPEQSGARRKNYAEENYEQQPSTSTMRKTIQQPAAVPEVSPQQVANDLIHEAELSKAKVYKTPGKKNLVPITEMNDHSAMVDENFLLVASHVDDATKAKIVNGEYIDFAKLIQHDRILEEEDGRVQMLIRNGQTFFVPVQENTAINSYGKWEQAFWVYSDIYTRANPHRAGELIQYNHIIHTISHSYVWDNVCKYDKDFRLHLGHFPQRNWGIILNQVWAMRLRDRLRNDGGWGQSSSGGSGNGNRQGFKDVCCRYNQGRCSFGVNCRFDHKCSYCFKFGHTVKTCRKLAADKAAGKVQQDMGNPNHSPVKPYLTQEVGTTSKNPK